MYVDLTHWREGSENETMIKFWFCKFNYFNHYSQHLLPVHRESFSLDNLWSVHGTAAITPCHRVSYMMYNNLYECQHLVNVVYKANNPVLRWSTSFYWCLFQLSDLDKLYIAMAEVDVAHLFDMFCYSLNIKSLNALKEYNSRPAIRADTYQIDIVKGKVTNKDFDFKALANKVMIYCTLKYVFISMRFLLSRFRNKLQCMQGYFIVRKRYEFKIIMT